MRDQYGIKNATRVFWLTIAKEFYRFAKECFWISMQTSGILFWGIVIGWRMGYLH